MNCTEVRQHWNLYHDSEGEAELHFQLGEHLAVCPDCAAWFHQQSRLESLLAEKLGSPAATPALWDEVLARSGLRPRAASRRAWLLAGLAACAAAATGLFWYAPFAPRAEAADLARLTAEWHQRLVEGQEPVQFQSQSDQKVESYLRRQVAFPVRCPPRKDAGFAVQGAGVCKRAEQPIAYLVGQVEETPVSIFILPVESLDAFPLQREAVRRDKTHTCREGPYTMALRVIDRNAVLVIGQTKPECLEKVLNAYGSYPEPNG